MRGLFLLRGCPGAGKSTYIKQNKLTDFTLNVDEIGKICAVPVTDPEILFNEKKMEEFKAYVTQHAKNYLLQRIEERMQNNEMIIVDAVHNKQENIEKYFDLLNKYKYDFYCIDFTDVPLKKCKLQNKMRLRSKWISEEKIDFMYQQLQEQKLPDNLKIIKPNDFLTMLNI